MAGYLNPNPEVPVLIIHTPDTSEFLGGLHNATIFVVLVGFLAAIYLMYKVVTDMDGQNGRYDNDDASSNSTGSSPPPLATLSTASVSERPVREETGNNLGARSIHGIQYGVPTLFRYSPSPASPSPRPIVNSGFKWESVGHGTGNSIFPSNGSNQNQGITYDSYYDKKSVPYSTNSYNSKNTNGFTEHLEYFETPAVRQRPIKYCNYGYDLDSSGVNALAQAQQDRESQRGFNEPARSSYQAGDYVSYGLPTTGSTHHMRTVQQANYTANAASQPSSEPYLGVPKRTDRMYEKDLLESYNQRNKDLWQNVTQRLENYEYSQQRQRQQAKYYTSSRPFP